MAYRKSKIPNLAAKLKAVHDDAVAYVNQAVKGFAQTECEGFKQAIKDQSFVAFHRRINGWGGPLSPARLAEKAAARADLRVMIATGHYMESIRVFYRKGRTLGGGLYRIGFHPLAHARDLDGHVAPVLLNDVARWQEHGAPTRNLRPRPHWGPYLRAMQPRATVFRAALMQKMAQRLKTQFAKVK